ncbi:MAG: hypothetical protein EBY32_11235 [Proteobacteria bacterium]|nr:hypothetical protein [Pseudomonadota bacterium]
METNAYGKPIRDRELLRRIKKARTYQCLNDPQGALHDPIEDAPEIKPIMRAVERQAEKESPNGARIQRLRARWPAGAMNTEFFESNTPPPQAIAIVSPSVGNYRDIWTTPAKKELQIKKGP